MSDSPKIEVAIVGAGPAGCAAAVMARSLSVDCCVIEKSRVGAKLYSIPALENMPGTPETGAILASQMEEHLNRLEIPCVVDEVVKVGRHDETTLEVMFASGTDSLKCRTIIWCAGVRAMSLRESPHVSGDVSKGEDVFLSAPNFVKVASAGRVMVVGADRPVATFLRAFTERSGEISVVCFPAEEYKVDDVERAAPGLRVLRVERIDMRRRVGHGTTVSTLTSASGSQVLLESDLVVTNLGSKPNTEPVSGLTHLDDLGFPEMATHESVLFAGDVAHASHQRISVALGDGARAALSYYYAREGAYGL